MNDDEFVLKFIFQIKKEKEQKKSNLQIDDVILYKKKIFFIPG